MKRWPALLALAFAVTLHAQEPDQPLPTLKVTTRVVAVQAVVVDSRGEPVRDLAKADFTLKQDGKEQEIRYFSQDDTLPLTLGLMVDTSSSQKPFLEDEIMASEKFFRAMLTRPEDRALLYQFDYDVIERQKLTHALQTLENSLNFLSLPHAVPPGARGGTLLYDAIVAGSQSFSDKQPGRRAMVLLTDGEDHGSRASIEQAVAAAQRADVVIYGVLYSMAESGLGPGSGQRFPSPGALPTPGSRGHEFEAPTGRQALTRLAEATGGQVFTASQKFPLDLIYTQIADDLRLQYQIGYVPPDAKPGSFHHIELKAHGKHLNVQARQGYFTPN